MSLLTYLLTYDSDSGRLLPFICKTIDQQLRQNLVARSYWQGMRCRDKPQVGAMRYPLASSLLRLPLPSMITLQTMVSATTLPMTKPSPFSVDVRGWLRRLPVKPSATTPLAVPAKAGIFLDASDERRPRVGPAIEFKLPHSSAKPAVGTSHLSPQNRLPQPVADFRGSASDLAVTATSLPPAVRPAPSFYRLDEDAAKAPAAFGLFASLLHLHKAQQHTPVRDEDRRLRQPKRVEATLNPNHRPPQLARADQQADGLDIPNASP